MLTHVYFSSHFLKPFQILISAKRTVIAPLMHSYETNYSNFWAAVDARGYYARSQDYFHILKFEKQGIFEVPLVFGAILIHIRHPDASYLTFDSNNILHYDGPLDDLLIFEFSAKKMQIPLHIDNRLCVYVG